MKQIILDGNYKYIFNEDINNWELYYQDKLHPKEPDKIYKYYFKRDIVEEVYIGHKIPDDNQAAYHLITNIVEEKYPNASMYVVYPHPHKLELEFEKIYPVE